MALTSFHSTIYPRSANAETISDEIHQTDSDFTLGKSLRFTLPVSIHSKSIPFIFGLFSVRIVHFTSRRHHRRARFSPVSPCPIHISIRSYGCPRTHASTIAHPLSSTRPTPSPGKKICVPKL